MSQDPEKYLYFTVGFLKHSFASDALWRDAVQHHMVDEPALLMALRLTEYYELRARGHIDATTTLSPPTTPSENHKGRYGEETSTMKAVGRPEARPEASPGGEDHLSDQSTAAAFSAAEQNAEEAANYWALL